DTPLHQVDADALVIAVHAGPDGPQPAPGTKDVDDALGGRLAATLATLGATGEAGGGTKIATGRRPGRPAPLPAGGGGGGRGAPSEPEALRRAAGAGVRAVGSPRGGGQTRQWRIALALPVRDQAETEAVVLGALLGGYTFGRYRSEPAAQPALLLVASG